MASSGKEIRAKLYKKTVAPSGFEFVIRKLSPADIFSIGGEPNLSVFLRKEKTRSAEGEAGEHSEKFAPTEKSALSEKFLFERGIRFVREVISRAVVSLKILLEPKDSYGDGEFYIGELPLEDALYLFGEIQEWSGWSKREAENLRPLSRTSDCSSTLTQSPKNTEKDRADLSERKEDSHPIRLTPSAPKRG